jgi:quinol monooxygenase YgiN
MTDMTQSPVVAVISHQVKDYAAWRAVYDANAGLRAAHGHTSSEVLRDPADPSRITVISRFRSMTDMKGFIASPDLKRAMQEGGVTKQHGLIVAIPA